ncbi:lipid asymmetry maintenance protein MlaB [Undibacterium rugosum]|uniref:STAS domain-containing protein n=1 Tax=Undibacterium rugosum TaxID=2762291 RepID=A0A923I5Z4_9BURK|nr:STAS domain-containing protein [Undibacterium rugosum]MBC3936970.1 STAS domain-containing protein [Undibacterium rugosum]MBR7778026.1 STAS domain-containing protein [Undibacterium rugosum]
MKSLDIQGELTIYTAATEKLRLQEFLDQDNQLEVNLSRVSEMDTAGLQILILMKKEAQRRGIHLRYVMHSPAVLEILELSNTSASFGDPVVLHS